MPPSLAERLLDAVWDKVEAAVTTGLSGKGESTLSAAVRSSDRPYGLPGIALPPWDLELEPASAVRDRVVAEAAEQFIQLRFDHRLALGIDALQDFDTGEAFDVVTDWAAAARRRELTAVLEILAEVGEPARLQLDAMRQLIPEGYGIPEFLLWEPLPGRLDAIQASFGQAPIIVAKPPTEHSWVRGLILRGVGGPSVRRGQDLTLDWLPFGQDIELVLRGHLRVYNATAETVTTLVDPGTTPTVGV
jgi:hypothetical protein